MLLHHEYLGIEFKLSAPKHSSTTSSCSAEIQTFNVLIHITGSIAKKAALELNFKLVRTNLVCTECACITTFTLFPSHDKTVPLFLQ